MANLYPPAAFINDGQSGGSWVDGYPFRVVLHTTETKSLPGYSDGATAPHLTFDPIGLRWWQHNSFAIAARALFNESGGVETNRAGSLQVEIICYSAKSVADSVGGLWVANLSPAAVGRLRAFLDWCADEFDVDRWRWPNKQAFSYGEANAAGFRMSDGTWTGFDGICGHQHVPENLHWDPGAIDWEALISQEDDMPLTPADIAAVADAVYAKGIALAGDVADAVRLSNAQQNGEFLRDQVRLAVGDPDLGADIAALTASVANVLAAVQAIDNTDNTAILAAVNTANAHLEAIRAELGVE